MVFVVHLGFLKSYERAGQVQVECVKGCRCKTSLFNTHDPADLTSQAGMGERHAAPLCSCCLLASHVF